ncbi:MAG: acetyl-CoA carboxylase biotin carboxyl carrier protein [Flavobacteriaceae bacterium]|jgi:acetyl-CoA carboxylase biotin carboxyl carrier protein|nr:acetyl-CoA carboxylase biotin carboxyl carrier protein [Flavobacteriaceae bacterium]
MDLKEIQNLIKFVAKSGASEVKLEMEDIKITIKTGSGYVEGSMMHAPHYQHAPVHTTFSHHVASSDAPVVKPAETVADDSNLITINSPIIGTLYRKPSPDKPNFIEVGDMVQKGKVVCIIEAMKLFNEIESEVSGKIVKILVDDKTPVEFGQPLFLVEPA